MDRDLMNRLVEGLQSDLKNLIIETRKKHPAIKDVSINHYILNYTLS